MCVCIHTRANINSCVCLRACDPRHNTATGQKPKENEKQAIHQRAKFTYVRAPFYSQSAFLFFILGNTFVFITFKTVVMITVIRVVRDPGGISWRCAIPGLTWLVRDGGCNVCKCAPEDWRGLGHCLCADGCCMCGCCACLCTDCYCLVVLRAVVVCLLLRACQFVYVVGIVCLCLGLAVRLWVFCFLVIRLLLYACTFVGLFVVWSFACIPVLLWIVYMVVVLACVPMDY